MSDVVLSDPTLIQAAEGTLRGVRLAEAVEAVLQPRLEDLVQQIPRLQMWRGFLGGAWVVGARTAGDDLRRTFARIDFELRTDPEAERVEATCRSTILSRDLPSDSMAVTLDRAGTASLASWIEGELLGFARRYFEAVATRR